MFLNELSDALRHLAGDLLDEMICPAHEPIGMHLSDSLYMLDEVWDLLSRDFANPLRSADLFVADLLPERLAHDVGDLWRSQLDRPSARRWVFPLWFQGSARIAAITAPWSSAETGANVPFVAKEDGVAALSDHVPHDEQPFIEGGRLQMCDRRTSPIKNSFCEPVVERRVADGIRARRSLRHVDDELGLYLQSSLCTVRSRLYETGSHRVHKVGPFYPPEGSPNGAEVEEITDENLRALSSELIPTLVLSVNERSDRKPRSSKSFAATLPVAPVAPQMRIGISFGMFTERVGSVVYTVIKGRRPLPLYLWNLTRPYGTCEKPTRMSYSSLLPS